MPPCGALHRPRCKYKLYFSIIENFGIFGKTHPPEHLAISLSNLFLKPFHPALINFQGNDLIF